MIAVLSQLPPLQDSAFVPQLVLQVALTVAVVAGMWKTFSKAGEPPWAAIVPIYNVYVMTKIGNNAWWWVLLMFVPVVNLFALAKISVDLAGAFGRGILFGLGLTVIPFVFYPILGFGGSQHRPAG